MEIWENVWVFRLVTAEDRKQWTQMMNPLIIFHRSTILSVSRSFIRYCDVFG